MSTTVKPLDIYIGDTKVFPDVDLDILGLSTTALGQYIMSTINDVNEQKNCYLENARFPYIITDTDDTAWHLHQIDYDGGIYNIDNYWYFNENAYDINATLDLGWLTNLATWRPPFNNIRTKVLNFKGTLNPTQGYDTNDWSQATLKFSQFWCRSMFENAQELEEINNFNFNQNPSLYFDDNYISQNQHLEGRIYSEWGEFKDTYKSMFNECHNLRVLDVEWPTVFYGEDFSYMFHNCCVLPDNQFPTMDLHPLYTNGTITIENMFKECHNMTSTHLTSGSWAYIKNAAYAWSDTDVHFIDIPATATNLINVAGILGDNYIPEEVEGHRDYSNWKYIIRTTSLMTAHLNSVDGNDPRLFDFSRYDENQDFMSTFGGIYVPDAQLQDWKDYISTELSASNIANNCVHGLSDL